MYGNPPPQRGVGSVRRGPSRRVPPAAMYPDEEEYASDAYEGDSFDEGDFEMMDARPRRTNTRGPDIHKVNGPMAFPHGLSLT